MKILLVLSIFFFLFKGSFSQTGNVDQNTKTVSKKGLGPIELSDSNLVQKFKKFIINESGFTLANTFYNTWSKTEKPTVVVMAVFMNSYAPAWGLNPSQYVSIPEFDLAQLQFAKVDLLFINSRLWQSAMIICFIATLETLLSIEALDKIDPQNRVTPQNVELIAQGIGNFVSGMIGGIPITSVIVRSSANVEAGARTRLSSFLHGIWLLLTVMFAASLMKYIPYCVLAVILIRTGYGLARPSMIMGVYRQGREQFMPFVVTLTAILFTDLLIGVFIGICFAIYFLIKHTYRAGYTLSERVDGHTKHFTIDLALNVSFLNKKKFMELLDTMPEYSIVEINGEQSVYIDHDILEIFQAFKTKAANRHIQLTMKGIPEANTLNPH